MQLNKSPAESEVNPHNEVLSQHAFNLLSNGPKFGFNVRLSRVDVCARVYKLAAAVSAAEEKISFIDSGITTVERLVDDGSRVKTGDFRAAALSKKELVRSELVLFQTKKKKNRATCGLANTEILE